MRESDFNSWLVQIANKEKESYQFGSELLYYTAAIDVSDGERPLDEKGPLIRVVPPLIVM